MTALRPLMPEDFPEIYEKYLAADDALASPDDWRQMFQVSLLHGDCCGHGLFDAGRLVGMVGMVFSERTIKDRCHRFCNLHTWQVDPPYRSRSLMLLRPALALEDHTLTDFTPTQVVAQINRRLGFQSLDSRLMILLPRWTPRAAPQVALSTDAAWIQQRADGAQAAILRDHPCSRFVHLLAESDAGACHVVAARVTRYLAPYCHIYHVSDPSLFRRFHVAICRQLRQATRTRLVGVDFRRCGPRLPGAWVVPAPASQFVRSRTTAPEDVDPLYSEVAYLRLTTMPGKTSLFWHYLRRPGRAASY